MNTTSCENQREDFLLDHEQENSIQFVEQNLNYYPGMIQQAVHVQ